MPETQDKPSEGMDPICGILDGRISEHVSSFEGTSQYTQGGTSACGLAALNAVRIILGREKSGIKTVDLLQQIANKHMIDEVVAICATWSSQLHLEVDDIAALPMFDATLSLSFSEYNQADSKHFAALLRFSHFYVYSHQIFDLAALDRHLEEAGGTSASSRASSAVVITRPPEILAVFSIPTDIPTPSSIFVVFDSHPRPAKGAKGASFMFFASLEATSRYISELLQVDQTLISELGGLQWQAQLLGHYSGHVFVARTVYDSDTNPMRPIYDANMDVLELKSRLADSSERIRTLTEDNSSLRERLNQLENTLKSQINGTTTGHRHPHGLSNSWTLSGGRSLLSVAGPSAARAWTREERSAPFPPLRREKDAHGKSLSSKEKERIDDKLMARFLDEQENDQASLEIARNMQEELDREDQELRSQMRRLQKKAQILFRCPICFDNHPEDSVAQVEACRHQLCRDCMKNYVTSKLKEHRYPITCPICHLDNNVKTPGVVTHSLVEQLGLTESQQDIWIALELSEFSIVLDCPKCRRCTFVDISDHTDMKLLQCPLPDCGHMWCKSCQRSVEAGNRHSCDGTLELDDLMKSHGWKYCPGCKTPAEKHGGCNHMTCIARGCNTHFCYVCGQSIVRSVLRRDIQSALSAHYRKCRLFEDVLG